jgi:HEAT repeat protein
MNRTKKMSMKQLLDAMLDEETPLHPSYIYRLSDLTQEDLAVLMKAWPNVPAWRRQAILEDIEEIGQSDYVLSFEDFARYGVVDSEPKVRELSVRTLWEYESRDLVPIYLDLLESDPESEVRAVAATALGKYVFLGEIEEIPESTLHQIEDKLLEVTNSSDATLVRRRALESLGYSSREDVNPLIKAAYTSGSTEWLASALFAMGQSANKDWSPRVISKLVSDNPDILYEAVRAAGELEIKQAVPRLMELLEDEDVDLRMAAAWSLSQIGGEGVRDRLEELYDEAEDDDEADFIDSALDNLDFTEDVELFDLLEIGEEGETDDDLSDSEAEDE